VHLIQGEASIFLSSNSSSDENEIITFPLTAPRKRLLDLIEDPHVTIKTAANDVINV
jgi:hypothetical protein